MIGRPPTPYGCHICGESRAEHFVCGYKTLCRYCRAERVMRARAEATGRKPAGLRKPRPVEVVARATVNPPARVASWIDVILPAGRRAR